MVSSAVSRSLRLVMIAGVSLGTLVGCGKSDDLSKLSGASSSDEVYVRIARKDVSKDFLRSIEFSADHRANSRYMFGYLKSSNLKELADIKVDVIDRLTALQDFDSETLTLATDSAKSLNDLTVGYHDYNALTKALNDNATKFPQLMQLKSAGKSVDGRDLWYAKISDNASADEDEPKVLFIANMHGDEVVGREMMVLLIDELLAKYGQNEQITSLVNHAQIYIMPSMNPDGFESKQRYNSNFSDLNRNFPDFTSDPETSSNGRELETAAIMKLHEENHFVLALNFHGGSVCMNLPWDTTPNETAAQRFADEPLAHRLARAYADLNQEMKENHEGSFEHGVTYGYEWYEVDGGMQDWANYYKQSTHSTVELSYPKWPQASQLQGYWEANRQSMINYLDAVRVGHFIRVVDQSGDPIAKIKAQTNKSQRWIDYSRGLIMRPASLGEEQVEISGEGIASQQQSANSFMFNGEFSQIRVSSH